MRKPRTSSALGLVAAAGIAVLATALNAAPPAAASAALPGGTTHGWRTAAAPLPAGAAAQPYTDLVASACASARACAVAGHYTDVSNSVQGLLLTGAGTSWTAEEAPLPAGAGANPSVDLTSIACPSATTCVAAGYYTDASGGQQGILLTGTGTSWTAEEAPLPAGAGANPSVDLTSIACPSATTCVAAGYYTNSADGQDGILVSGLGNSWSVSRAPLPAHASINPGVFLNAIACPALGPCTVAGYYFDAANRSHPLLLTGSGTTWTAVKGPLPRGAASFSFLEVTAVACSTSSACAVLGYYEVGDGTEQGLLLTGSGDSWTATRAPLPQGASSDPGVYLGSAACPAATSCTVIGSYTARSGQGDGVLLTGWGDSWTAVRAPLPASLAGRPNLFLDTVACPAVASCITSGIYRFNDTSGHEYGTAVTGSGSSWSAVRTPVPAGADPALGGVGPVTCATPASCLVIGSYAGPGGAVDGLLLTGAA
jgi:hypothetical protein